MEIFQQELVTLLLKKLNKETRTYMSLREIKNDKLYDHAIKEIKERLKMFKQQRAQTNINKLIILAKIAKLIKHIPYNKKSLDEQYIRELEDYMRINDIIEDYLKQLMLMRTIRYVLKDV
jgi:hypothetical protein